MQTLISHNGNQSFELWIWAGIGEFDEIHFSSHLWKCASVEEVIQIFKVWLIYPSAIYAPCIMHMQYTMNNCTIETINPIIWGHQPCKVWKSFVWISAWLSWCWAQCISCTEYWKYRNEVENLIIIIFFWYSFHINKLPFVTHICNEVTIA